MINSPLVLSESNRIEFFECWMAGDTVAIYYTTLWGNTTLRITNNDTWLEPYSYKGSTNFSFVGEGHSRWNFTPAEGTHIIEAYIYNQEILQIKESYLLNLTKVTITITLNSTTYYNTEFKETSIFESWLSNVPLWVKITFPSIFILIIIVSITIIIKKK